MIDEIESLGTSTLTQILGASSVDALEQIRVDVLGKKGSLSQILRGLAQVAADDRPKIGSLANQWKTRIEDALSQQKNKLGASELKAQIQKDRIDVTAPSRLPVKGALHLITQVTQSVVKTFEKIGFQVTLGPEVETDYLCFEAVNIPAEHPARDMQDTFYLDPGVVLRTHTTPVQMRTLFSEKPPIRILCPGAVFRRDHDATHSPMFHQIEGLWVDEGVKMSHLKGVLEFFAQETFGKETRIRLRPSYFPFVEPGAEVDVSCFKCRKAASADRCCQVCKGTGWLEILGAGMVHPNLFKAAKLPSSVTGFAFGIGIERMAMLLYQVPDLRLLYQNDFRFLRQFSA